MAGLYTPVVVIASAEVVGGQVSGLSTQGRRRAQVDGVFTQAPDLAAKLPGAIEGTAAAGMPCSRLLRRLERQPQGLESAART